MIGDIDAQLIELDRLQLSELRIAWVLTMKTTPPKVSAGLMRLALAHGVQVKAYGQLSKTAERQFRGASGAAVPAARPGTRFVRAWRGTAHVVTITDQGKVHWNERDWNSLSEVARAITGTRWSGPAFFGLTSKRKVAA